ncbi:MAG: hypothetical protein AAB365_00745 [Patescibacteria group bacterium]
MDLLEKKTVMLLATAYASGFFAWNLYLGHFGIFEYDLLQTRFLSAGTLILFPPILTIGIWKWVRIRFSKTNFLLKFSCLLIWIYIFSNFFFPFIPQWLGGAKPYLASIIADEEELEKLRVLGISFAEAPEKSRHIETARVCKIYENRDIFLLGFSTPSLNEHGLQTKVNRVLSINRSNIKALSILPQNTTGATVTIGNTKNLITENKLHCGGIRYAYGIPMYSLPQK